MASCLDNMQGNLSTRAHMLGGVDLREVADAELTNKLKNFKAQLHNTTLHPAKAEIACGKIEAVIKERMDSGVWLRKVEATLSELRSCVLHMFIIYAGNTTN